MGILAINVNTTGLVGDQVTPRRVTMTTTDNIATITTAGYLNNENLMGNSLLPTDTLEVIYGFNPQAQTGTFGIFRLTYSYATGFTMVAWVNSANVLLPVVSGDFANFNGTTGQIKDSGYSASNAAKTKVVMAGSAVVADRIAHFVDVSGTIDDTAAAVTNAGNIYAGLDAVAGAFRTYPATTATGYLGLTGVSSAGAFNVIISNASHAQSSTYSIPDCGASTANLILSKTTGTQHITVGSLQVDAGTLSSGISTGGQVGTLQLFPTTTTTGSLRMLAAANAGAFNVDITNASHAQSTVYTIADIGASTGGIPVATTALTVKSVAGAAAAGGNAAQSFTDAFCTSGSNVIGNWNTQANAASVLKIVPGNGSFVVTSSADAGVGTFNYIITK